MYIYGKLKIDWKIVNQKRGIWNSHHESIFVYIKYI